MTPPGEAPAQARPGFDPWRVAGWSWLAALLLGPVAVQTALGDWVPTTDGPFHLAQAWWWSQVGWQGPLPEPVATHWEWNPRIDPNLGAYPVLAGLMAAGLAPSWALGLWLLAYGAAWLGASAFAAGGARAGWLTALLSAPLAYGYFVHAGFLNYALGLVGVMLFVGLRRQQAHRTSLAVLSVVALALLALALAHIVAWGAALLYLTAEVMVRAGGAPARWPRAAAHAARLAVAALPGSLLALSFLWATREQRPPLAHAAEPSAAGLKSLLQGGPLLSFSKLDVGVVALCGLALVLAWALASASALASTRARARAGATAPGQAGPSASAADHHPLQPGVDEPALASSQILCWGGLLLMLTVLEVRSAQGVSLSERLVPLVWVAAALWTGTTWRGPPTAWRMLVLGLAMAGLMLQTALRWQAYRAWAPPLQAAWQAGGQQPAARWVGADLWTKDDTTPRPPSWRVMPGLHLAQLAAVAGGGVGLSSPLGSTVYFGYFPLRHRAATDWFGWYPAWEETPLRVPAISNYRQWAGSTPDALLARGPEPPVRQLARQLGLPHCQAQAGLWLCTANPPPARQ